MSDTNQVTQEIKSEEIPNTEANETVSEATVSETTVPKTEVDEPKEEELDVKDLKLKGAVETKDIDFDHELYSDTTFEELNVKKEIIDSLYIDLRFTRPTFVQAEVLPSILSNPPQNVIAQSKNGTGKTACFSIGMLSRVDPNIPEPQVICLCTTREIAKQTFEVIQQIGGRCNFTFQLMLKETDREAKAQVIVGTTGTIYSSILYKQFDMSNIKVIVVDEADEMFKESKSRNQKTSLSEQARNICKKAPRTNFQLLLFSATFSEKVFKFVQRVATDAVIFRKKDTELKLSNVPLYYIPYSNEQAKIKSIVDLYSSMVVSQALIFVNERDNVEELAYYLKSNNLPVEYIHGALDPSLRDLLIKDFKDGKIKVLICTNVLARGFDCSSVTLVINYDIPYSNTFTHEIDYDNFLHRVGRTGRMGKKGIAITLVKSTNEDMECLRSIEQKYDMLMVELDPEDMDQIEEELNKCKDYNQKRIL